MGKEIEMEMRAREDIGIGQDITPPLPPLSFALHDSFLLSHCSACFSPLPPSSPTRSINGTAATTTTAFVAYCSDKCATADDSFHFSSAEHHLFLLLHRPTPCPPIWPYGNSSDLRTSLRLLHHLQLLRLIPASSSLPLPDRIAGLMTNRKRLMSSTDEEHETDEGLMMLKEGARAMAMARAMRDGRIFDGDCKLEEAAMCIVRTNAVEVLVLQKALGIAVYDGRFSWMNHSCSPNSSYRFQMFSEDLECLDCAASLRISPAADDILIEGDSAHSLCELARGCSNRGPRLIARSINRMKRGDPVTVTYTDLMQPRMLRQSELWFKYQFFCSCIRCNAVPLTYVDHALQETFLVNLQASMTSSITSRDKFTEVLRDYFDSVVSEYFSTGNPFSCCEKIENMLTRGHLNGGLYHKGPSVADFGLSPIHYLSLSAYTTLCSVYKVQASLTENRLNSFHLSRISSAYSLLLAGATHHLFLSEPSLIASAANFWTDAGESLVSLARSSLWPSSVEGSSPDSSCLARLTCNECLLLDNFEADFCLCIAEYEKLNETSRCFRRCMTNITPKAWNMLVQDCQYLMQIEDPLNFNWLEPLRAADVWEIKITSARSNSIHDEYSFRCGDCRMNNGERTNVFMVGAHCLVYGVYLSYMCSGVDLSSADYVRKLGAASAARSHPGRLQYLPKLIDVLDDAAKESGRMTMSAELGKSPTVLIGLGAELTRCPGPLILLKTGLPFKVETQADDACVCSPDGRGTYLCS